MMFQGSFRMDEDSIFFSVKVPTTCSVKIPYSSDTRALRLLSVLVVLFCVYNQGRLQSGGAYNRGALTIG